MTVRSLTWLGLAACGAGLVARGEAGPAWVVAGTAVASLTVGSLVVILLCHAIHAAWWEGSRTWLHATARLAPAAWLLAALAHAWGTPQGVATPVTGWAACVVVTLAAWWYAGPGGPARDQTLRRWSGPVLLVVGTVVSLAGVDVVGGHLLPWRSTILGLHLLAGGLSAALAVAALAVARGTAPPPAAQRKDLGTLLLSSCLLWGYVAYAQALPSWYARLPVEESFLVARASGPWWSVAVFAVAARCVVPAALLLVPGVRSGRAALGAAGCLVLLGHVADTHLLLSPAWRGPGDVLTGTDVAAWGGLAALVAAAVTRRGRPQAEAA
jgi:hypothetical protein